MPNDLIWAFKTPSGASAPVYVGSFFEHASPASTFSPGSVNLGTTDVSYAAHVYFVLGAPGGVTLQIDGTSIDDNGVRTPADQELIDTTGYVANDIVETDKKWLGQVSISVASGTPTSCNYGWVKYWDNANQDFVVRAVEATWLGAAADSNFDLHVYHYRANGSYGWTYNAGGAATPPTPFADLTSDHSTTENNVANGEYGCWKRVNLSQLILGSGNEGLVIEVDPGANNAIEFGNINIRYQDTTGDISSVARVPPPIPKLERADDLLAWSEEMSRTLHWALAEIHRAIWGLNVYGGGNTDEGPVPPAEP